MNGEKFSGHELVFEIKKGISQKIFICFDTTVYLQKRPHDLNTVRCGSLVFSLPIKYEKKKHEYERDGVERRFPYCDYEYLPVSDWNYAYCNSPLVVENREIDDIPFSSENPPVVIKAAVQKINWDLEDGYETVCAKTPKMAVPLSAPEEILLYPYGCAKLRMTELPLIKQGIK